MAKFYRLGQWFMKFVKYFFTTLSTFLLIFLITSNFVYIDEANVTFKTTSGDKEETTEVLGEEETSTSTPKPEYVPVTLAFVGDVDLNDRIVSAYENKGLDGFLSSKLSKLFLESDVFGLNHEYVSSDADDTYKVDYELWYYKHPTNREYILNIMGADVVSLANNHTMDYGEEGLVDTMNAIKNTGVKYVGAGNNLDEAKSAYIKEVNGKTVAVLAANRVVPRVDWYAYENKPGQMTTYEGTDRYHMIQEEIKKLKSEGVDIVVVLVHFGENKDTTIQDYQYNVAHAYVDAGADLIIGSHIHLLQGAEIYKGKYIFYGVGNFLFENYAVDTVAVTASIASDNKLTVSLIPCKSQNSKTIDVTGSEAKKIFDSIVEMSVNIGISEDGLVYEKN